MIQFIKRIPVRTRRLILAAFLCMLPLFAPLQAKAAGWNPQPLPDLTYDTVFGDFRYLDPAWLTKKVTITYQGNAWVTGMDAFADIPVRLSNENGQIGLRFKSNAVFDSYFSSINAQLTALTAQENAPLYDNGNGSYIHQNGQLHYEAKPEMAQWLADTISAMQLTQTPGDISLELSAEYLTPVSDSQDISVSPDFVRAGTCTTSYATSGANRSSNIAVAASHIHNLVVMPGQTISVSDAFLPRTAANGYKSAGVYINGVHTNGMGGGVCQVSSTLYNAVMNAGLTVTQRYPHSMPVTYLDHGLDAAIAAGSKDLKFRNDYGTPVILQATTSNKKLTVNVLVLKSELNGRSWKLWAKQLDALSSKSYLTAYQDGKEVKTTFVATSRYKPYRESGE